MSQFGHSFHLHGVPAKRLRQVVTRLRVPIAVLARGRAWTSFVPLGPAAFDPTKLARLCPGHLLALSRDDDSGSSLAVFGPTGDELRLSLPPSGPWAAARHDHAFVDRMHERGLLTEELAIIPRDDIENAGDPDWKALLARGVPD